MPFSSSRAGLGAEPRRGAWPAVRRGRGQAQPGPSGPARAASPSGLPPPTIRDYKPRSTLVVPQHPVPRAKFPVIDIHSHQPTPISAQDHRRASSGMDANNLRLLVNLSGGVRRAAAGRGYEAIAPASTRIDGALRERRLPRRRSRLRPEAAAQLEADIKAGAMGVRRSSRTSASAGSRTARA